MEIAQISLITEEIPDQIPKLLEERDILVNMEEGTNSSISISYNEPPKIMADLEKYINLNEDNINYESEDENLLHIMDNIKLKNSKMWNIK